MATERNKTIVCLRWGIALNTAIIVGEMAGGFYANSLGLLGDALHNLLDEGTMLLTYFAYRTGLKPDVGAKVQRHKRLEVLATWVNCAALLSMTTFLIVESIRRLWHPPSVGGITMMVVAVLASMANLGIALVLKNSIQENLGIHSCYLHNLGDAAISLSPVVGGLLIVLLKWNAADPLIGLCVGISILFGTGIFLRNSKKALAQDSGTHPPVSPTGER